MRRLVVVLAVVLAVAVAVLSAGVTTFALVGGIGASPGSHASPQAFIHSCSASPAGFASCHAILNPNKAPPNASTPSGYGPSDLQSAYNTPSTNGSGVTVAIVDAYDAPTVTSDLNTYRRQYNLPAVTDACSGTGPWFCKVNQTGGASYPRANAGWATEISLDVEMVSAICPKCNILLVEANSNSNANLYAADDYAAAHAKYISNSWSGGEYSSETSDDSHFSHGQIFTFATGDSGYGAQYPATSPNVIAVGGTSLNRSGSSWSETAWSGAGSGCSAYEPQQSWQSSNTNVTSVCSQRAEADVSAVADPNTGVAVYDTTRYQGRSGWQVYGGTSVATPILASVYALSGNTNGASYLYSHADSLNDVTGGSNGSCSGDLCHAATGWDGPTGLGTPNGITAF